MLPSLPPLQVTLLLETKVSKGGTATAPLKVVSASSIPPNDPLPPCVKVTLAYCAA